MPVRVLACLGVLVVLAPWAGATDYNEFVDGDLSDLSTAPTVIRLAAGPNVLVAASSSTDFDLVNITIPANHTLNTISIEFHDGPVRVFTALEEGPEWTAGVGYDVDPSALLGWVDFPFNPNQSHVGADILAEMALAPGSLGFETPLASGDYTLLFQSQSTSVPFAVSFNVSAGSAGLAGDFTGDAVVDGNDLVRWRSAFGVDAGADANQDGRSDGQDFLIWQRNLRAGSALPIGATVPEPAAIPLGLVACSGLLACRGAVANYAVSRGGPMGRRWTSPL
jgi:hypothetical protein